MEENDKKQDGRQGGQILCAAALVSIAVIIAAIIARPGAPVVTKKTAGGSRPVPVELVLPGDSDIGGKSSGMVALKDGSFLWRDADGRFFQAVPRGKGVMDVVEVYRLVHDPQRHRDAPERRRFHGYYLDPVSGHYLKTVEKLRDAYSAAVRDKNMTEAVKGAGKLGAKGDVLFLKNFLDVDNYAGARSSAIALGNMGYGYAAKFLFGLYHREPTDTKPMIVEVLKKSLGGEFVRDVNKLGLTEAMKKWEAEVKKKKGD